MNDKDIKLFGVTGNPVLHSKSPLMFNAIFKAQGTAGSYARIAAGTAQDALFLFNELRMQGMNVTAPFKQDIMPLLDEIDTAAGQIGGVNTVVREAGKLKGYNTDHLGVTGALSAHHIDVEGNSCIVLGCGGAGRAAVYSLVNQKANVTIVNRTFSKGAELASHMGCGVEKLEKLEDLLKTADLLVSTLSPGIDWVDEEWLRSGLTVFDANYKQSPLIEKALKKGCPVIKGEDWLLHQAYPAYTHFIGQPPDETGKNIMKDALLSTPWVKPRNIALVGFMGCGKSTVGKILAEKMKWSFKDMDDLIERKEKKSIPRIFKTYGEKYFRTVEARILKEELERSTSVVFGCGGGAVLKEKNRKILKTDSLTIWLYATVDSTLKRLEPGTRPLLDIKNDADGEARARELLNSRLGYYGDASGLIVSGETGAEETAEKIYAEICKTFGH